MPAVQLLERDNMDASLNELMQTTEDYFGHVPELVKALANNPPMCKTITEFTLQALGPGRIDWALKELIILKTLRSIQCTYSYGAHEKIAADLGVPLEKIGDVANSQWQTSAHYSDAEKALFKLVEQIAEDANDVSDELWEELRNHWDNGQLLEVNAVITTFIMIGRVGDSLGVSDPVLFSKPLKNV
ncbi:MAG TPA: carboxymuconolactone decarboxylase family protein [Halalkalibaculum sp.]|nr:carboxymuconolactone decarboxylase family protein [Halalkalibaculum sp.]